MDESKVTHAKVRFPADEHIDVVPVSDIKEWKNEPPNNVQDFDRDYLYTCLWVDQKNPNGVQCAVQVAELIVYESDEQLEKIKSARIKNLKAPSQSMLDEYSRLHNSDDDVSDSDIVDSHGTTDSHDSADESKKKKKQMSKKQRRIITKKRKDAELKAQKKILNQKLNLIGTEELDKDVGKDFHESEVQVENNRGDSPLNVNEKRTSFHENEAVPTKSIDASASGEKSAVVMQNTAAVDGKLQDKYNNLLKDYRTLLQEYNSLKLRYQILLKERQFQEASASDVFTMSQIAVTSTPKSGRTAGSTPNCRQRLFEKGLEMTKKTEEKKTTRGKRASSTEDDEPSDAPLKKKNTKSKKRKVSSTEEESSDVPAKKKRKKNKKKKPSSTDEDFSDAPSNKKKKKNKKKKASSTEEELSDAPSKKKKKKTKKGKTVTDDESSNETDSSLDSVRPKKNLIKKKLPLGGSNKQQSRLFLEYLDKGKEDDVKNMKFLESWEKEEDDRKVKMRHLLGDISIKDEEWQKLKRVYQNDSLCTKNLLRALYTREALSKRSSSGSTICKTPHGVHIRKRISPVKRRIVNKCLKYIIVYNADKINKTIPKEELKERISKVGDYITEEIGYVISNIKKEIKEQSQDEING